MKASWFFQTKECHVNKSTGKLTLNLLFDSNKIICTHFVASGKTVNEEYFVEVLSVFRKKSRHKRPEIFHSGSWHVHQYIILVQNSILVTNLTEMIIKSILHPPYIPDFAPCNYSFLPKLKNNLKGGCIKDIAKIKEDFHGGFIK